MRDLGGRCGWKLIEAQHPKSFSEVLASDVAETKGKLFGVSGEMESDGRRVKKLADASRRRRVTMSRQDKWAEGRRVRFRRPGRI